MIVCQTAGAVSSANPAATGRGTTTRSRGPATTAAHASSTRLCRSAGERSACRASEPRRGARRRRTCARTPRSRRSPPPAPRGARAGPSSPSASTSTRSARLAVGRDLADDQRHRPGRVVVGQRRREPPLGEPDRVAVERDLDRRVSLLEDPGVHDPADRLPARLLQRVPQVVRLGVRVRVRRRGSAGSRRGTRSGPSHCSIIRRTAPPFVYVRVSNMPLASSGDSTGNSIGRVLASASTSNARHPDRLERIEHAPGRLHRVDAEVRHERRERLVQPDPVPPAHRDEVAEPHVRELVRDRLGDVEPLVVRRLRRIEQQQRLAVGDEPGVLHRALREVRDRRLVELLLRVRDRRSSRRTSPGRRRRPRSRSRPGAAGRDGRRPGSASAPRTTAR